MVNFFTPLQGKALLGILALVTAMLFSSPCEAGAQKFKKSTSVDFEGALVEGKSRKPYSAYLTQQKDSAFGALHSWKPDFAKKFQDAQTSLEVQP